MVRGKQYGYFGDDDVSLPTFLCHSCIGTLPSSLCVLGQASPLSDLIIGYNQLTGSLDISTCVNLFFVDATVGQHAGCAPIHPPAALRLPFHLSSIDALCRITTFQAFFPARKHTIASTSCTWASTISAASLKECT